MSQPVERAGFSLIEVILSIAILFASTIALAQLASLGRQHGDRAESLTTAQILCQNKMNEIVADLTPLVAATDVPFVEAPGWAYSIEVQTATSPLASSTTPSWNGLVAVKVSVAELSTDDSLANPVVSRNESTNGSPNSKPKLSIVRWLRITERSQQDDGNDRLSTLLHVRSNAVLRTV